jgi:hypothetical protein
MMGLASPREVRREARMLLDYQDEDTRTWVVRCVDDESGNRMDLTGANLHLLMTSLVEGTCTHGEGHWQD